MHDLEGGMADGLGGFSEAGIRRVFIRNVYGILSSQLLVTLAVMAPFLVPGIGLREVVREPHNWWIILAAFTTAFLFLLGLTCCESVARRYPANGIFLFFCSVFLGVPLGMVSAFHDTDIVFMALSLCIALTLALTLFAFLSKWDLTGCIWLLLNAMLILTMAGFLMLILPHGKLSQIGYSCAGVAVFSLCIVLDTQLMMGGDHKYAFNPEDYVFAALTLYLDIANLFLCLLSIIDAVTKD